LAVAGGGCELHQKHCRPWSWLSSVLVPLLRLFRWITRCNRTSTIECRAQPRTGLHSSRSFETSSQPIRSVLSLTDLDAEQVSEARYPLLAKRISLNGLRIESTGCNIVNNSKSVSLTGTDQERRRCPPDWLPEDVDPYNVSTSSFQNQAVPR
jgi:hypothetical protein